MKFAFSIVAFLAFAVSGFGQNVRGLQVGCRTASGSVAASDNLRQLKALDPNTPGVREAITECEGVTQTLRQREDALLNQAQTARDAGDCAAARLAFQSLYDKRSAHQLKARDELQRLGNCTQAGGGGGGGGGASDEAARLQSARGAFNAKNFPQAKSLASPLAARPGPIGEAAKKLIEDIDRIERNNQFFQQATLAVRNKRMDQACERLVQIEATDAAFPGLKELKTQAGGCPVAAVVTPPVPAQPSKNTPANVNSKNVVAPPATPPRAPAEPDSGKDPLRADYENAMKLIENARFQDAEKVLVKIRSANPEYKDVDAQLASVREEIKKITQGSIDQRFSQSINLAKSAYERGDFQAAMGRVNTAAGLKAKDSDVETWRSRVQAAIESENKDLIAAIDAYYTGHYTDARQLLTNFLKRGHSARIAAVARFYSGAAAASEFFLTGSIDQAKKEDAKRAFALAVKDLPTFAPDWNSVSRKIQSLYAEAVGQQ